jgi:cell division protein FtsA
MTGIRLEVETHIIFGSTPAIKNLKRCLDQIGIKPQTLNYSGIPTALTSLTDTEKELGVALVDIGGQTTTLTIFDQTSPAYSSVIPVGGNNITNDLAIGLRLSIEEAEKLKIYLDKIDDKGFTDEIDLEQKQISSTKRKISIQTAVNGIIKPRLEEIFGLVKQKIEESHLLDTIPAGIVLTGGGSLTVGSIDIASKILNLPIRIASPQNIGGLSEDISNPMFTSAIGLLFYGINNSDSGPKPKKTQNIPNILDKIKSLIEPLLP